MGCARLSSSGNAAAGEIDAVWRFNTASCGRRFSNGNAHLDVRWTWIKGHNGHCDQSRADALAYQAARTLGAKKVAA
jgi:ribonuclease HI